MTATHGMKDLQNVIFDFNKFRYN